MSRLGGWVRWIGCAAVWEAGRAVCGERHLQQTQAYSPTATEDDGVGRGDIHTYAIVFMFMSCVIGCGLMQTGFMLLISEDATLSCASLARPLALQ